LGNFVIHDIFEIIIQAEIPMLNYDDFMECLSPCLRISFDKDFKRSNLDKLNFNDKIKAKFE